MRSTLRAICAAPTRGPNPARGCGAHGTPARGPKDRPDKVVPRDGAELARRWVQELVGLGYHDPSPTRIPAAAGQPVRVGTLDRDGAARDVLTRLGARRSGWNAADVRGQVEQLIAGKGNHLRGAGAVGAG